MLLYSVRNIKIISLPDCDGLRMLALDMNVVGLQGHDRTAEFGDLVFCIN